jgi:D-proline reductase (dithiol) PrdB
MEGMVDIGEFRKAYEKWVAESEAAYRAGEINEIMRKYPFVTPDDIPWTPYHGQPSGQKVALVTSGGLYMKETQTPFDTSTIHGDPGFRAIPRTAKHRDLAIAHPHYDHSLAKQDINAIFPLERLVELEADKVVGSAAATHYSFGYVNDVIPLVTRTIPELIRRLKQEAVDALLLVPV